MASTTTTLSSVCCHVAAAALWQRHVTANVTRINATSNVWRNVMTINKQAINISSYGIVYSWLNVG